MTARRRISCGRSLRPKGMHEGTEPPKTARLETEPALGFALRMKSHRSLAFILALLCTAALARADYLVYFGTYTGAKSKGIYVSRMNDEGKLSAPELAAETASPSYL